MKTRILHYLMCLILLVPFVFVDNLGEKIHFLRWIAFPVIILMLGFLIYKTRQAKWVKKVAVAFVLTLSLGVAINVVFPTPVYAETPHEKLARLEKKKAEIEAEIEKAHAEGKSTGGIWPFDGLQGDLEDVMEDIAKLKQEIMAVCPSAKELLKESCDGCWPCDLMALIMDSFDKLAEAFLRNIQQKKYAPHALICIFV